MWTGEKLGLLEEFSSITSSLLNSYELRGGDWVIIGSVYS